MSTGNYVEVFLFYLIFVSRRQWLISKMIFINYCRQYNNRFFREYVKMLSVRVGSSNATYGGELYRVTEIFFHPNYKPNTLEFNLAILKLHKNITPDQPNTHVAQIDYSSDKNVPTDSNITFLGWGSVMVSKLLY